MLKEIKSVHDIKEINAISNGIVGVNCWDARLTYADELTVHMGKKLTYDRPKQMKGKSKGEWILGSRGTGWIIESSVGTLITSHDPIESIRTQIQNIVGTLVSRFEVLYPSLGLVMGLANGYTLSIVPSDEDNNIEVAFWELYTPYETVLMVGPKNYWSHWRQDDITWHVTPESQNLI